MIEKRKLTKSSIKQTAKAKFAALGAGYILSIFLLIEVVHFIVIYFAELFFWGG